MSSYAPSKRKVFAGALMERRPAVARTTSPGEGLHHGVDGQLSLLLHLVFMNAAKGMRHEGEGQALDTAVLRLEPGQGLELRRPDHDRRDTSLLQHDSAVDTPRRAGPSVSAPDEDEVALCERVDDLRPGGPRHRLIALHHLRDAVAVPEMVHDREHERSRIRLAVVQNPRALTG